MRRCLGSCLAAAILLVVSPVFAQDVHEIPFDSVPNFLKLPTGLYLGEAVGVAQNSKGHVFVFTRSGETRLFEFDQTGEFVREIGDDLYGFAFAHVVRVDSHDNIWTVDEGTNMVVEFNPEGRVIMTLGRRPEAVEGVMVWHGDEAGIPPPPGPAKPYAFYRPTDIAWDADGNIFISDGYGNSRIVKYDKDGRFLKSVGTTRGKERGQFNVPHTIATDAKGNVYVGDRENSRMQVFDNDLNFKAIWTNVGDPWAICITPGPKQYLYSSNSNAGPVYKMDLDGHMLGKFGAPGKEMKQFGWVHEINCTSENELLVAEILNWRVQKLVLHPQAEASPK
jgi:outer membrane protein assembly factor BamB